MPDPPRLAPPGSPEELLVRRFDLTRLPRHVAIIMDGNGRWAKARNLPRVEGHRAGVQAVKDTVEAAASSSSRRSPSTPSRSRTGSARATRCGR